MKVEVDWLEEKLLEYERLQMAWWVHQRETKPLGSENQFPLTFEMFLRLELRD